MSLKELSKEQIEEISMIELATIILEEEREAMDFNDLFNRIASLKNFTEQQKENNIAQFLYRYEYRWSLYDDRNKPLGTS
ncbi:DNA-directed RNA polymerase subunit delta [Halobacillus salinus]|uniref:DNA-directed RNA polymerase subunit delta n=1 Tax=Halobacillus salinus TaxID=192814 RepID=UPI0030C7DE80